MLISATDRVRAELERSIVDGSLPPGVILDETHICQQFSVSRTPVREALLLLSALGFVRIVPRAGIYVVRLSARELDSMFALLAQAEGLCARLVIGRINDEQIHSLQQLQQTGKRAVDAADVEAFCDYTKSLHEFFYQCCGNSYLVDQILLIRKRVNPYRLRSADYVHSIAALWAQHGAIINAILHKDEGLAGRLAVQNIISAERNWSELVSATPANLLFDATSNLSPLRKTIDIPRVRMASEEPLTAT